MTRSGQRSVGHFVWNTSTGQWSWDRGMYELHGYQEGAVVPSIDLVLAHKQEDCRARAAEVLEAAAGTDGRFSNYHVIVDVGGREHTVLTVGQSRTQGSSTTPSCRVARGFMVDVTEDESDSSRRAVQRARQSTAPIQQSTGLLMGYLGLSEEAAFAVISRVSQHHNVKIRDLARRFMAAAVATAADSPRDLSQLLIGQASALALERARSAPRPAVSRNGVSRDEPRRRSSA